VQVVGSQHIEHVETQVAEEGVPATDDEEAEFSAVLPQSSGNIERQ
jgi:hypothetical protein